MGVAASVSMLVALAFAPAPFVPEGGAFVSRQRALSVMVRPGGVSYRVHSGGMAQALEWRIEGVQFDRVLPLLPGTARASLFKATERWIGLPTFERVRLEGQATLTLDVAPSLAWRLELPAGFAPSLLRFSYRGAHFLKECPEGACLEVHTGLGVLKEAWVRAWQVDPSGAHLARPARYRVDGLAYRIEVKEVDPGLPLIIDPPIEWGMTISGSAADSATAVAIGASGQIFVAGSTGSPDLPVRGALDSTQDAEDAFIARFDGLTLGWLTYLGGTGGELLYALVVDPLGRVCAAGLTNSANFPLVSPFQPVYGGQRDGFVACFNAQASALEWSSFLGGNGMDYVKAMAVDPSGALLLHGQTQSSAGFPLLNAFDATLGGTDDAFLAKVSPSGALVWSSLLGGSSGEAPFGLAVDRLGDLYVTGQTKSADFPTPGGFDRTYQFYEAYVAKISGQTPTVVWGSYLGGSNYDIGTAIAVDDSAVWVGGTTYSSDFPWSADAGIALWGPTDLFLAKIAPDGGSLLYATGVGDAGIDEATSLALLGSTLWLGGRMATPAQGGLPISSGSLGLLATFDISGSRPVLNATDFIVAKSFNEVTALAMRDPWLAVVGNHASTQSDGGASLSTQNVFMYSWTLGDGGLPGDGGPAPDAGADGGGPDGGLPADGGADGGRLLRDGGIEAAPLALTVGCGCSEFSAAPAALLYLALLGMAWRRSRG